MDKIPPTDKEDAAIAAALAEVLRDITREPVPPALSQLARQLDEALQQKGTVSCS